MEKIAFLKSVIGPYSFRVLETKDENIIIDVQEKSFIIPLKEIENFIEHSDDISNEPETAIFYPGYYEHYLEIVDPIGPRSFLGRGRDDFELVSPDSFLSFEISRPSTCYLLFVLQNKKLSDRRIHFISPYMDREKIGISHWNEAFRSLRTVKVKASKDSKINDIIKLRQIAEAGLFHFAYGNSVCFNLASKFERDHYRLGQRRRQEVQFPRRIYNSELLSYYNLALSSDSLLLGYIALYKILEYFFPIAAENALHKRMMEKLITPDFSHTKPKQLRELAKIIRQFDQRMDEQKMLVTVIDTYFSPNEIIDWVNEHEKLTKEKYYTLSQKVLGETFVLDMNPDKLSSSLAKRIYHTRNVLVHNKEDEPYRFIPFTGQEENLTKEIPIVLFLVEQLIIKTGKDL